MIKAPALSCPRWAHYLLLMRLHRPIGSLLLLWPTLIALCFAGSFKVQPHLVMVFTLGVFIMRSAGCVINDWADRRFDGLVERTKTRPLVTGVVSSKEALWLFVGLLVAAFALVCTTNTFTIQLSIVGILLAACYPFTKRFTHYPQVVLGMAYGWAIPMAYAAQSQTLPLDCWLLYLATLIWALAYDTLYAMVDREDDLKIGVKSTAIAFGKYDKMIVALFQIVMLVILVVIGNLLEKRFPFYIGIAIAGLLFIYQQWLIKTREPQKCFQAFLNNNWVGMALFVGAML